MNKRVCRVLKSHDWIEIDFKDLKENDIFRLYEPSGEKVMDEGGKYQFVALCAAYQNEDGIWTTNV